MECGTDRDSKEAKESKDTKAELEVTLVRIAKAIKENRQIATPALAPGVIKDLFEAVPDLECIQREVRQTVTSLNDRRCVINSASKNCSLAKSSSRTTRTSRSFILSSKVLSNDLPSGKSAILR